MLLLTAEGGYVLQMEDMTAIAAPQPSGSQLQSEHDDLEVCQDLLLSYFG